MAEPSAELRDRLAGLTARLADPAAAAEREQLKGDIAALCRMVERELTSLAAVREQAYGLIDQWKALPLANGAARRAAVPRPPVRAAAPQPVPMQADHLGASTFIEKGWHQISVGDATGAEASLNRALVLAPGDTHAEALLGWALMLQEKHDDALLLFQRVLLRDPHNSIARVNVGCICLRKGIFGEAIEHLSRVIRSDNDRKATLYAHFYLGLVYLERDMYDDAQSFFRKTLALGPNLIEAYFELGRARWFGGDVAAAREAWREGFAANKFSPWGKRCAEILATVEAGGAPLRSG